ncbi:MULTISPECIES: DMT family transporter [unclassified Bacillus (in: firmicutes)]|uniref:DMT family transporter n=1 Tax=unclassified Bacillus (in: firmicutes) TaxID=185979 RepID=UPI0008EA052B|nr:MULTISPECIES: DMT family transporter [unclassified Bacillus (in: firmicutes)]SFA85257.1 Permease of the drug/metabolite transporter (DMT) superfamily [Bacillus sp. UNCCL13]SFQ83325.1 Permease of the drug/metabolite transporter (DMT) superfamily [Bacillus sp. cl95]
MKHLEKNQSAYFLLVLANVIWGGNFVIGRVGTEYFPPITFSILRWSVAFLFLTPFMVKPMLKDFKVLWRHKWIVLLLSVTGVAGYNTIIYFSLNFTTSINASIVNSTTPLFIAIFSFFMLKERLSLLQGTGLLLSVIGIVFILSKGSFETLQGFKFNPGDLFVLVAVVNWSIYSIVIKKNSKNLPAFSTLYATSFVGILILFPLSLLEIMQTDAAVIFNPESLLILGYVGFFASIVAFISWNTGVSKIGAAKSGIFINLLPVFATLFATIFTKEDLLWYQIAGGVIVLLGVVLSSQKNRAVEERSESKVSA